MSGIKAKKMYVSVEFTPTIVFIHSGYWRGQEPGVGPREAAIYVHMVGLRRLAAPKDLKLLRSFGPTALVRRLVPAPGLDG